MPVTAVLRRKTTVADPAEFAKRAAALESRLVPYLQRQPGFVGREMRLEGSGGDMVETTTWATEDDCRRYLRGGAAAMAATWLDAFLPTAPYPDGTWVRSIEPAPA
jgi:hypothetical protein